MKVKKKITKKKLKQPDEFISFTEKAFLFINLHLKKILVGGVLISVLVISFFLFKMWENRKEEAAVQKFSLAVEVYQTVSSPYREGTPAEYKNTMEKFDEIIKTFPGTSSGKISLLYKGNLHLRIGEPDEAIKSYQAFLEKAGKERLYRLFALEGLGYAYEGKKDYERAVKTYEEIIQLGESYYWTGAHLNLARSYEKLGKKAEALENYNAFLKVSNKSSSTHSVLRKISSLEK
jgi:tetratricopeptide (TPR) repeat protein